MPICYCDADGLVLSVQGHKVDEHEMTIHHPDDTISKKAILIGVPVQYVPGEAFSVGCSMEQALEIAKDPSRWQFNGQEMVPLGTSGEPSPVNTKRSNAFAEKIALKREAAKKAADIAAMIPGAQ